MSENELGALIGLLDDPDEHIFEQIRGKIMSFGEEVIPMLESAWEANTFGVLFQSRVENIIHEIQFDGVQIALKDWADNRVGDLLEGVTLIARYQYPDLDEAKLRGQIEQIQQDIWLELNHNLTAYEQVKIINHILYDVHGFSGNTSNYHAPQNSYINNVLESKKGNPLSLSILYSVIGQNLGLPILGVNLPRHFILAYLDPMTVTPEIPLEDAKVLFYVNPFSRGGVFSRKEIDFFLRQLHLEYKDQYFRPCDNRTIVQRVINNLQYSYEKLGYPHKVREVKMLGEAIAR
ncbi:MAG: transglutaminase-like domain-containing protein [Bacteroidota bacterium]